MVSAVEHCGNAADLMLCIKVVTYPISLDNFTCSKELILPKKRSLVHTVLEQCINY